MFRWRLQQEKTTMAGFPKHRINFLAGKIGASLCLLEPIGNGRSRSFLLFSRFGIESVIGIGLLGRSTQLGKIPITDSKDEFVRFLGSVPSERIRFCFPCRFLRHKMIIVLSVPNSPNNHYTTIPHHEGAIPRDLRVFSVFSQTGKAREQNFPIPFF